MKLQDKIKKYGLTKEDWFKHQHYTIITRRGIEKIQGIEKIKIKYEVVKCEEKFAVFKAIGFKDSISIETYGSALKGDYKTGNCNTWYVAEMAEKRAMSRVVLKITGFYELGVFGEDESEDFKQGKEEIKKVGNVKDVDRRPNLTLQEYTTLQLPNNKDKLDGYLKARRMTPEQREVLQKLVEICK
tara:strand:+ start:47 stop:604 length:558 start_codon:yes stop_codon:yes gene_type:complete